MDAWLKVYGVLINFSTYRRIDPPKLEDNKWTIRCTDKDPKENDFTISSSNKKNAEDTYNQIIAKLTNKPGDYTLL